MLLDHADFSFISFEHLPVLRTNSPNKFFDAIAMGNAILINHKGWGWDLVHQHGLGLYFDHRNPQQALEELEKIEQNPDRLRQMKQHSRHLAESRFSTSIAIEKLLKVLRENS